MGASAWILIGLFAVAAAALLGRRGSRHALRAWLGLGLSVRELARRLDVREKELLDYDPRYRRMAIPKRTGGHRRLLIPDERTKALQRRILRRLLARLRSHDAAYGFEKGRSIVHNAAAHCGRAVVVRMDVVDFFPNTLAERVEGYFRRIGWNRRAAALLARWTTEDGGLPQGAPTSPRLSNLVNFRLDAAMTACARAAGAAYTRYADDLTFSFDSDRAGIVRDLMRRVRLLLGRFGYEAHWRKKVHVRRRHQRQEVCGLVVNERVALPRRTRRWLRAVEHRHALAGTRSGAGRSAPAPTLTARQLEGWRALRRMVESQRTVVS